jgi:hypothetical protein
MEHVYLKSFWARLFVVKSMQHLKLWYNWLNESVALKCLYKPVKFYDIHQEVILLITTTFNISIKWIIRSFTMAAIQFRMLKLVWFCKLSKKIIRDPK